MIHNEHAPDSLQAAIVKLWTYCHKNGWAGFDPYDSLNSRIFQALKFLHSKYPRLVWTQMVKKCPWNFRPLLLVPRSQNPKAIALFLSSSVRLARSGLLRDDEPVRALAESLMALSSFRGEFAGWGYNFDWQALTGFVPRGTPNIICTTFGAHALMDAYEYDGDPRFLDRAFASARFIQSRLFCPLNEREGFYCYIPPDIQSKLQIPIHNANLLAASLLSRVARLTQDRGMRDQALKAARYSLRHQHADGAWDYGECDHPSQRWIDNFHTGFNLCALRLIHQQTGRDELVSPIRQGFEFYRNRFFTREGAPKYYHDRIFPIDIHSAAQSIVTLVTLKELDESNLGLAWQVFLWAQVHMYDRRGFYYYQKHPWGTIKIPYMRWSQAWMLLALSTLFEDGRNLDGHSTGSAPDGRARRSPGLDARP